MANIDKAALVAELKNSIQNPRAGEVLIQRIEQGDFDLADEAKPKKGAGKPQVETATPGQGDIEER